jgi:hypothetical protein
MISYDRYDAIVNIFQIKTTIISIPNRKPFEYQMVK